MKDINAIPLTENLKDKTRFSLLPAVDPVKDLLYIEGPAVNGWFVIGHYLSEGHVLNYMLHFLYLHRPTGECGVDVNISMTDETSGWYTAHDAFFTEDQISVEDRGGSLYFKTPNSLIRGTLDGFHVEAVIPGGEINCDMKAFGGVIYNGGFGNFPTVFGANFNQYSVPNMQTTGNLTMDGKTYEVAGKSWLDRQWQYEGPGYMGVVWKWSWMDINLDCGDVISMWDMTNETSGLHGAWATVLHPDGTQTVAWMAPWLEGASEYWTSGETGRKYPTRWKLRIPDFDAELEVVSRPRGQEIIATVPYRHKYEGASTVSGKWRGRDCAGYCYSEIVGHWN